MSIGWRGLYTGGRALAKETKEEKKKENRVACLDGIKFSEMHEKEENTSVEGVGPQPHGKKVTGKSPILIRKKD